MTVMLIQHLTTDGAGKWSVYSYTPLTAHTAAPQVSRASTQGFNPDLKNLKS